MPSLSLIEDVMQPGRPACRRLATAAAAATSERMNRGLFSCLTTGSKVRRLQWKGLEQRETEYFKTHDPIRVICVLCIINVKAAIFAGLDRSSQVQSIRTRNPGEIAEETAASSKIDDKTSRSTTQTFATIWKRYRRHQVKAVFSRLPRCIFVIGGCNKWWAWLNGLSQSTQNYLKWFRREMKRRCSL